MQTEQTWDAIAESFNVTRQHPWKHCLEYISTLQHTATVADIGCGNGRHTLPLAQQCHQVIGIDVSKKLLRIIQGKLSEHHISNVSLLHSDSVELPIQKNSIDAILCIASLHNIKGKQNRLMALQEINRILKPQATALISVWSRWQDRYQRYFMKQFLLHHRQFGDIDIYWRQQNLNIPRYYHLYSRREFSDELQATGFHIEKIQSVKYHSRRFPDNFFAVVRKR
jgi:alkylated DNA repair protein alkB family protein 8